MGRKLIKKRPSAASASPKQPSQQKSLQKHVIKKRPSAVSAPPANQWELFKKQLVRKGWDKVAEGGAPRKRELAHGGEHAEATQQLDLEGPSQLDARALVTDLPHGAPIRCIKGKALAIRYDRVVTATWGRYWREWDGGIRCMDHLGAPSFFRNHDDRFQVRPNTALKGRSLRTSREHYATMAEVLQFQVDNDGRLPTRSSDNEVETKLRKRYDRVTACGGKCGALERMRVQWSRVHANVTAAIWKSTPNHPIRVGDYLLGRTSCSHSSFRSNAARAYAAIMLHLDEEESLVAELEFDDTREEGHLRLSDCEQEAHYCLDHQASAWFPCQCREKEKDHKKGDCYCQPPCPKDWGRPFSEAVLLQYGIHDDFAPR
jgi:hypothetical protein